jgi:SNF2 family DNA or RNA helicase
MGDNRIGAAVTTTFGTVSYVGGSFLVKAPPHVLLRLRRTFESVSKLEYGEVTITDTIDHARDLEWFLSRYPMEFESEAVELRLSKQAAAHRERASLVERVLANLEPPRDFEMAEPPREYQRLAAELALAKGSLLLVDEMGLGKTIVGICVLSQAIARPALCVVPKAVQRQWRRQLNRFAPKLRVHILKKGSPADDEFRTGRRRKTKNDAQLHLLGGVDPSSEAFPDVIISTSAKLSGWADTLAPVVKGLVLDEVQEFRHGTTSQKGAAAAHIAKHATVRLGLTGTPIYNYGGELFNVIDLISPGVLGSATEFSNEWCGGDVERVSEPRALGAFLRSEGIMLRRTRVEVGRDLPPFERVFHPIDCDEKPLEEIEESARALAAKLLSTEKEAERGERLRAAEELSVLVRQATGIAKAPHVADFVRMIIEGGEKVVLFGWHRAVYDIWLKRLKGFSPVMVTGSESDKQKDDAVQRFCKGDSQVIIISLRSAAGLDGLQYASRIVVHGELDYSPGVHEQCDTRVFRDGQAAPVLAYYLESDEGSDPIVSTILKKKGEQLEGIRDPDVEFFAKLQTSGDHVKQLAARYLNLKGAAA